MVSQAAKDYLAAIGRRGGQAKTAAKSKAARANGKLGGRPKIKRADNVMPAMAHCRQEQGEGVTVGATLDIPPRLTHK